MSTAADDLAAAAALATLAADVAVNSLNSLQAKPDCAVIVASAAAGSEK